MFRKKRIILNGVELPEEFSSSSIIINVRGSGVYMSSINGGSVVISSGGSQISIGGSDLEFEIDKGYERVNRVSLKESANDVNLALSQDDKVYVKGLTSGEPEYNGERLFVDGLEGTL